MQEKAEVLAGVFSRASQSRHLPEKVPRYRAEEESRFETPVMDNSTPFNGDLTLKDLKTAISGLGTASKATGEDPISFLPHDPPVHGADDKDAAQVLPDMLGVWNGPVCLEGSPGRCHPQRRKAK